MHQPTDSEDNVKFLRRIYWIAITNALIGFPFFLSHVILAHLPFPALGLIPLTASFLLTSYRLIRSKDKNGQYQIILGDSAPEKGGESTIVILLDVILAATNILAFALTCVFTYARSYGGRFQALAAHATMALLVDAAIHGYLFVKAAKQLRSRAKHDCAAHCSNCRAAREAAEGSDDRYTDIVEVTTGPRDGGGKTRV